METYSIEMNSGSGFVEVSADPLLSSPAVISNADVTSGAHLIFRYRARNVHGWSAYSPTTTIVAATIPDAPTDPASLTIQYDHRVTL